MRPLTLVSALILNRTQGYLRRLPAHRLVGGAEGDRLSVWHSTTSTGAAIVDHRSHPLRTCVRRRVL